MKSEFLFAKKIKFLTLLFSLFILQASYSQCATGDPIQDFCDSDNNTLNDIETDGVIVIWFDALTLGNQYNSATPLVNGTTYYALESDASCIDPTRFAITVNVYGAPPNNVDVFVGKCASEAAEISNLTATGTDIKWYDAQTGGTEQPSGTLLVDGTTYWVQQTENGCVSDRLPTTVTIIDPPSPTVVIEQSFCASDNPTVADLQATETNVLWYASEVSVFPLDPGTPLIHNEDYWATQITFPCESTIRTQVNVKIDNAPDAGTNGSYSECEIDAVTTNLFDLLGGTPENTGTWTGPSTLSGGSLGTFDPNINIEGDYIYTVPSLLGVCPDSSATVSVTITIVPPPTTTEVNQTFCEIDNPTIADLTATGTGVLWYDTETSTIPLNPTDVLVDTEDYWASQSEVSGCESDSRLVVTVTIIQPLPPSTSEANQTFCEIDNPTIADLNAIGTDIIWYDTETSTTPLNPTDILLDSEDYWASQTEASGCESATRLGVTVTISTPLPPTTTDVNQTFCNIDNPTIADLNATGDGIIWYDTEISTTPLNSSDALIEGEDYWASQTEVISGCESITRLVVNVTIIDPVPPTTTETSQSFCEIDNPTIADLSATGTGILWYDTETSTTPLNSTDALIDSEDYWASQTEATNSCESISRLVVNVIINEPTPPTTTETTQTFCDIDSATIADLNATGSGILWFDTETSITPLLNTDSLIDGEDYWASQTDATNSCESASRLVVSVTIITPTPPTTTDAIQTFCEIENATIADLNVTGDGILWYDTETSTTALNATDVLIDGEDYWATQTESANSCESVARLNITVNIIETVPPTTTEAVQTFCEIENATVADLIVSGNGILWYDTETSTAPINSSDLLVDGEDYWASQTEASSSCESTSRLSITVQITTVLPPTTTETNQVFCLNDFTPGNPTINDLSAIGTSILWYDSELSTTPLDGSDNLVNGEDYWASQTETTSGCESATRLVVTVTIVEPIIPTTTNTTQTFCIAENPTIDDLNVTGNNLSWFDDENSTTPLLNTDTLVDGEDYWAASTEPTSGCESISRLMVTVSLVDIIPPTVTNISQSFCAANQPTVANLDATGNGLIWYSSETDTTQLSLTELLINGEDYWAVQTNSTTGCESSSRVMVSVTLTDPGTPIIIALGNEFCKIDNPTLADLNTNVSSINGGIITWYDSYPGGAILSLSELLTEGATYYGVESDTNSCASVNALEVTVSLEACEEYDVEIFDGFSPTGNGINDTFKLGNIRDLYPNFTIEFFNRWGEKVYTSNASKPDWNGRLHGDGELVPAGVYFFVINFNKNGRKPIQKRLYLSR